MSEVEQAKNEESNEPLYTRARKRKLESFKPQFVRDLYEEFQVDNWALQAFGELLYSANLEGFTDDCKDSGELRHGLRQIIEMYLDRQQEKLKEIHEKSWNCPEDLIERAKDSYDMVRNGKLSSSHLRNLEEINKSISDLEKIILEFGDKEYPQAGSLLYDSVKLRECIQQRIEDEEVNRASEKSEQKRKRKEAA